MSHESVEKMCDHACVDNSVCFPHNSVSAYGTFSSGSGIINAYYYIYIYIYIYIYYYYYYHSIMILRHEWLLRVVWGGSTGARFGGTKSVTKSSPDTLRGLPGGGHFGDVGDDAFCL